MSSMSLAWVKKDSRNVLIDEIFISHYLPVWANMEKTLSSDKRRFLLNASS